jgi:hypothetical protein
MHISVVVNARALVLPLSNKCAFMLVGGGEAGALSILD